MNYQKPNKTGDIFSSRFDREETELTLDSVKHLVKLHDTAGQEDYERLRKIVYKQVSRNQVYLKLFAGF